MFDILVHLFEQRRHLATPNKLAALTEKLKALGFDEKKTLAALKWLNEIKSARVAEIPDNWRNLRIFTPQEREKLGSASINFVAFLESAKVITPTLRELIIERSMMLEAKSVPLSHFSLCHGVLAEV
ncbi:MAG: DUF494 family protein, partial [Pseudomonadota bacterium]